jgi:hypothetical protein
VAECNDLSPVEGQPSEIVAFCRKAGGFFRPRWETLYQEEQPHAHQNYVSRDHRYALRSSGKSALPIFFYPSLELTDRNSRNG